MKMLKEVLAGPSYTRIVFNLGILSAIFSFVDHIMSTLYVQSRKGSELDDSNHVVQAFRILYFASACISCMQFISCCFFVYGSMANKPRWFMPWLLVYSMAFLLYLGVLVGAAVSMYVNGQASSSVEILLRCLISGVLNVYFLLICFCVIPRVDVPVDNGKASLQGSYYDCMLANA